MHACCRVDSNDTVELATLLRFVAPQAPEIPYEMALDMLRQSYTEFARRTNLLVAHQTLDIQRGVRNYKLEAPVGYEVFALLDASNYMYGYTIFPNVNHWYYGWGDRFRLDGNAEVIFELAPSQDNGPRHIALHVLPNECATTIPREISVPYGKAIAMGALADIFDMPNKAWSNPRAADVKRREFHIAVGAGKTLFLTNRGAHAMALKPLRIM